MRGKHFRALVIVAVVVCFVGIRGARTAQWTQGTGFNGMNFNGMNFNGMNFNGMNFNGMNFNGMNFNGMNFNGAEVLPAFGADRARVSVVQGLFVGVARSDVTFSGPGLAGLQGGSPRNYTQVASPMTNVRLQRGPNDTGKGNFIYVPGVPDLTGTIWNMVLQDACTDTAQCPTGASCTGGVCVRSCNSCSAPAMCVQGSCNDVEAGVPLYISDVRVDTAQNSSRYPANDDIWLYTVYFRHPVTLQWSSLCPVDPSSGGPTAMAVPLNPHDWSSDPSRAKFTFACTASGVAAKCARNWGYKPWVTKDIQLQNASAPVSIPFAPFYDACLVAARADYCQDDHSYTKNGTPVDLFDSLDGGFTSINATAGLPYAPFSTGVMLHEEYQISALDVFPPPPPQPIDPNCPPSPTPGPHLVSENYTCGEIMSLPPADKDLVSHLSRSGMQSSRYADLDPGRMCAASPYIDRCDPKEPYACYRAANLNTSAYGAFLAVNSARHCSHDECSDGEPLDPLCNECVNRVCQVDPSCCGDPGAGFYPGSLVWDDHCAAIRQDVCRSTPRSGPAGTDCHAPELWPTGVTAPPAGSHPVTFLRGAIGAFERFVTDTGGTTYAEGWACDPDHPDASIPVQISIGGALGAGTSLKTAIASEVLAPSWKETVSAECGGGARHGFHVAMPAASTPTDVYVYGIDTDVPGAPFSLLRGGKKTLAATPPNPYAVVWTGWIEPNANGQYAFCRRDPTNPFPGCVPQNGPVNPSGTDLYRVWVNGLYVAGNWQDVGTDAQRPGAITADPPTGSPAQQLRAGVRYAVRIEYRRPAPPTSGPDFQLLWYSPDRSVATLGGPAVIPASAFYPMAPSVGSGLRGAYYAGVDVLSNPFAVPAAQNTIGALDYLWTGKNQPIVGPGQPGQPPPDPLPGFSVGDSFSARFEGQVVPPTNGSYTFTADTDGRVRIFVNGQLATEAGGGPPVPDPDTCSHDICRPGAAVSRTCRQGGFCAAQICLKDGYCCGVTWDSSCLRKVADVCRLDCSPTPPTPITLLAGQKAEITVEYEHIGTTPGGPIVRGGRLRLEWAVAGGLKEPIPAERLFAGVADGTAAAQGVGLNAAYFSDPDFKTEVLDRVEVPASAPPSTTLLCTTSSCGAGGRPAPPALVAARSTGVSAGLVTVELTGRGAVDGATVDICEGSTATGAFVPTPLLPCVSVSAGASATTGGMFTASASLGKGAHTLAAKQTVGAQTSDWSAALAFDAQDPATPPPPTINAPSGGYLTGNNSISVGGTAAPGATVTVKIGNTTIGAFTAGSNGNWSGSVTLPGPGGYALTITQTVGGVESTSSASASARAALPILSVSSPTEGACISTAPGTTCDPALLVAGSGADDTQGAIHVGDGDGTFFADHATVAVQPGGAFSGPGGTLDYGRHKIKIFQRTAAGDDAGVVRTVLVKPPAVTITAPSASDIVDASITVIGQGLPRVGLPGTAIVYQGANKLGETTIDVDGSFHLPVQIAGAATQTLIVKQTASSLSGGGAAEGEPTEISIIVKPPAPAITSPATASAVPGPDVPIAGTALAGATVAIFVDKDATAKATAIANDTGHFTASVTPGTGTHRLKAQQTLMGATGALSAEVLIAVGDVTPPTVKVRNDAGVAIRELPITTTDPTGAKVDFADSVTAEDCVSPGVSCTSLVPTCSPASGSLFTMGATAVTCAATDAAGNTGSTSFLVVVQPPATDGPTVEGLNLVAEAEGPDGAPVAYQVSATGFVADCGAPGATEIVPCTTWQPAYSGLGFAATAVAIDPNDPVTTAPDGKHHGTLYATDYDPIGGAAQLVRSTDGGATWEKRTSPWQIGAFQEILVGPGSPASLYVPAAAFNGNYLLGAPDYGLHGGLKVSRDGGDTWTTVLEDRYIEWVWADPNDPAHMIAVQQATYVGAQTIYLYETHDAWATWANASTEGLPARAILGMAFDPLNPGRLYATVDPAPTDTVHVRVYRKVGNAAWERLDIPPFDSVLAGTPALTITVAPTLEPGQTFPTVFAGPIQSRDGGNKWEDHGLGPLTTVVFDRVTPGVFWAGAIGSMARCTTPFDPVYGSYACTTGFFRPPIYRSVVQDAADPGTFYSAYPALGLFKTEDGGTDWTPTLAPGISLPDLQVKDIAFDPADAQVAYLLSGEGGVFRTKDGAGQWTAENAGLADPFTPQVVSKIAVDRFNRNSVFLGGAGGVWKSPDGPGTPTDPNTHWAQLTSAQYMGVDPFVPDTVYATSTATIRFVNCDSNCPQPDEASYLRIHGTSQTAGKFLFGHFEYTGFLGNPWRSFRMQFLPGADRPLLMTFLSDLDEGTANASVLQSLNPPAGQSIGADTGLNTDFVFSDASSGVPYLFAGGDGMDDVPHGGGPILYRARPADVRAHPSQPYSGGWEAINPDPQPVTFPDGSVGAFTDFTRLVVDPASGGQVMYTVGAGNTRPQNQDSVWESHDGGRTWRRDGTMNVSNVWLSPVDGALYATRLNPKYNFSGWYWESPIDQVARPSVSTEPQFPFAEGRLPETFPGVLWKRTNTPGTPPGARVVRGDLRPTCTGDATRATGPGATFPLGPTTITCTATDAYGHVTSQPITITVRDTTPPVLFVPTQVTATSTGGTANVDFTVSALDVVDGARPVTCDHLSGSAFSTPVTTVNCSASDTHGNVGRASFPVILTESGGTAPTLPVLTTPGDVVKEATAANGATFALAVTAKTGGATPTDLTPLCQAPLGTGGALVTINLSGTLFPIGTTDVSCSATSGAVTIERAFRVTVRDTTPPELTVPADDEISRDAENIWGLKDVRFSATALDAVDGALIPSCTPESGSTFPIGSTLVTCRAADHAGNRATKTFHVVIKGLPPKIVVGDVTVDAEDRLGRRVTFDPAPSATDTTGQALKVDCIPTDKSWFPLGDTPVSCTATDGVLESRGSFVVHVVDKSAPQVLVPQPISVEAVGPAGTIVTFETSASDVVDGACTPAGPCRLSCSRVTGVSPPVVIASPALFPIGVSTVICTATDGAGNPGSASFTVTVRDTTPPVLTIPVSVSADADATGVAVVTFNPTATDTVGGAIPVGCTPRSGSQFLVGTTRVSCSARDAANNEATGSFDVIVKSVTQGGPGSPCALDSSCNTGLLCVDGVCCTSACGGGIASDCQACSVAAGGSTNGTCTPVIAGRVCRGSAGACDVAETCNGSSNACPADTKVATGTTCRASGGACDPAEACDGHGNDCPADAKAPAGTTCRASAGTCDVAEICDGSSSDCPADALVPAGTTCRASAGACDVAEACTGSSPACPADAKTPAGTVCRASAGTCDVAETCTGSANACPADALVPAGTTCRAKAGVCDVVEACTGSSAACPADAKVPGGTVCRAAAGACDTAETCSGSSNDCPADALVPAGTTCRVKADACDVAETCTGTGAACPPDALAAAGTVCAAGDTCHSPAACSGTVATCPAPAPIPGCGDTTPPVFSNVPGTIVAYATCKDGAAVTYTLPKATDAVDGVRPVTCTPASGSTFALGKTTVTCTAYDTKKNKATATFTVWVQVQAPADGTFFLQPINPDGSSIFKMGSTVPVKFKLTGTSAGITNLVAKLTTAKVSNNVTGTFVEAVATGGSDSGNTFRYDASAKQYIFNLSTKSMATGTWSLRADLGDLVTHTVNLSLK